MDGAGYKTTPSILAKTKPPILMEWFNRSPIVARASQNGLSHAFLDAGPVLRRSASRIVTQNAVGPSWFSIRAAHQSGYKTSEFAGAGQSPPTLTTQARHLKKS